MFKVKGRYPYRRNAVMDSEKMTTDLRVSSVSKCAIVRIDDDNNMDFWMEIYLSREDIEDMLLKINES